MKIIVSEIATGAIVAVWRPIISQPFTMGAGLQAGFVGDNDPLDANGNPVSDADIIANYTWTNGALTAK